MNGRRYKQKCEEVAKQSAADRFKDNMGHCCDRALSPGDVVVAVA